jgi:hypothetical protein
VTVKPTYWLEYLKHPVHKTVLMAGVAASVLASLPWGGDAFALGLLAIAALETVAVAVVPSLPPFREWADKKARRERLGTLQERLMAEINAHGGSNHLQSFVQMQERVSSLYRMARDPSSTLSLHDVEQLEDSTFDYLRLCLSDAVMKDSRRKGNDPQALIEGKLADVRAQLQRPGLTPHEAQQLRRAEADFVEALARQGRMASRKAVLDAALVSMPVRMEEVYQMVMTSPRAGNMGSLLEDALAKLRLTEEVTMDLDQELGLAGSAFAARTTTAEAPPPRRTAQTTRH